MSLWTSALLPTHNTHVRHTHVRRGTGMDPATKHVDPAINMVIRCHNEHKERKALWTLCPFRLTIFDYRSNRFETSLRDVPKWNPQFPPFPHEDDSRLIRSHSYVVVTWLPKRLWFQVQSESHAGAFRNEIQQVWTSYFFDFNLNQNWQHTTNIYKITSLNTYYL